MVSVPAAQATCLLYTLPNEILIIILSSFPTASLLPWTAVSTRFHDLVLRILHHRLLIAASLQDHKLILECYHPASRNTEPYLFCDYLGTPGLSSDVEGEGLVYADANSLGRLGKLSGLYSRFRPIRPEVEARIFRPRHASDLPGQPPRPILQFPNDLRVAGGAEKLVEHTVSLDENELFSQLCVVTNLVQLGPRRGVFSSFVTIADGVLRLFRWWLNERIEVQRSEKACTEEDEKRKTLWLNDRENLGLRLRVGNKGWRREMPVLIERGEDRAASFGIEYEGLLVRTTTLLLAVEEALLQGVNSANGKAMIFGSFATPVASSTSTSLSMG